MIAGRYTLDREIGRGGMGAVWLGKDEVLGRIVAIKKIGALPGASSPDLLRAEREARIAARVNHPHVVGIYDLVHEDDVQWLVMEYVEGTTLAQLIRTSGVLSPDEAAPLLAQAAEALSAAHAAGIVHRDVKPSNMLVTPDGQVKLSDFGIARAEADASLTQTGLVTGSPAYISPEVASGRPASAASDVWSLGASAFHAVTGHPPYDVGDNILGALYRIVHEAPPRTDQAGWLTPMVASTLVQDPDQRWSMATVGEFLRGGPAGAANYPIPTAVIPEPEDVEPTQRLKPVAAPVTPSAPRRARRSALPMLLVAATVLVLVLGIAWVVSDGDGDGDPQVNTGRESPSQGQSSSKTAAPEADAAAMESFAARYVATADRDPAAGFALLTPDYQSQSGGLEGYTSGFWGEVSNAQLLQGPTADPKTLIVEYTYRYTRGGKTNRETVRLQLQFKDGKYLIAGAP